MSKQSFTGSGEAASSATIEFAKTNYKVPAFVVHGVRCGDPSCKCATTDYRHGPYAYLYWREGGHARRRYVRKAEAEQVRAIIELRQSIERDWRERLKGARGYLRLIRRLELLEKQYESW